MEEGFQNLCKNSTNDFDNCYNDTITNETVQSASPHNVEITHTIPLDLQVKYYCEGVILVPLAIAGLFVKKYVKLWLTITVLYK